MGKRRNLSKRRSFKRRSFKRRSNLSKRRSFKRKRTQKRRNNMKGGSTKEDKRVIDKLKTYLDITPELIASYDSLDVGDKTKIKGIVDLKVSPELQKLYEEAGKPLNLFENKQRIYTNLQEYSEDYLKERIREELKAKYYKLNKDKADLLFHKIFSDYNETDGNMKFEDYCRIKLNDEEFNLFSVIYSELLTYTTQTIYDNRER